MAKETQSNEQMLTQRRKQRHESRTSSTYKGFLKAVCAKTQLSEAAAEKAAIAVLCTLEQRITAGEAGDLNAQLPYKVQQLLHRCERHEGETGERFGRQEFMKRVGDEIGEADQAQLEGVVRGVFQAVRDQISDGEVGDVTAQLPQDLRDLWSAPA
jgi:uncharacterized protein (DUF2267 family)